MKAKLLSFVFASIALVLLASFSSALTVSSAPSTLTISSNSTSMTVQDSIGSSVNIVPSTVSGVTFSIAPTVPFVFDATSKVFTISAVPATGLKFGEYVSTFNISNGTASLSQPVTFLKGFCKSGSVGGNLSISSLDISDPSDEDEEWILLNNVEIEVEVENNGDNDIDDVQIELGLFDSSGNNVVNDLDFSNADEEKIEIGDLKDGDSETVTFEFKVPADFDAGSYKLAVKAYSKKLGETKECIDTGSDLGNSYYESVSVNEEDDEERFVVVDDVRFPSEAICGETVTGSLGIFNVGEDDQDQIKWSMVSKELGLNQEHEIRDNLDKGDDKTVDFSFVVPSNAKDGTYNVQFKTFYDYRNGNYREELKDANIFPLKVIGCSNTGSSSGDSFIEISADSQSSAQAGETLMVDAVIRNTGSDSRTVFIDASGYESWANLDEISSTKVTLDAGKSKTVTFTLTPNSDVSGAKSFSIDTVADGVEESQRVEVEFTGSSSSFGSIFGNSGIIWLIVAINVVLIVLIIIVAIRIFRR